MMFSIILIIISPYTALLPSVYFLYLILTRKLQIPLSPWNKGLFVLFGWALIAGIANKSLFSILAAFVILLYFSMSAYIEARLQSRDVIEQVLRTFVHLSVLAALFGFFEKLSFRYFHSIRWQHLLGIPSEVAAKHRIYSTFGNPNVTGAFMASMILVSIYFISKVPPKVKIYYGSAIFIFSFALYLTGSRGAEIGLLLGLLTHYQLGNHKHSIWVLSIALALLVYLTLTPFQFFNIRNLMYRDLSNSFSDRYSIWKGCLKMIQVKPFVGWGLMGVFENSSKYLDHGKVVFHAHNLWLSMITSTGLIGLGIYGYMKYYIYSGLRILYRNGCLMAPLLAGIQAIVIGQGLVDFTIITPQSGILFIGSASLIHTLAVKYKTQSTTGLSN